MYLSIRKKHKGFTLIEVLIALFIFAILAILTMRGVQTTLDAKHKSKVALDALSELEIAYTVMQEDIEQIVNRNAIEPRGGLKLAFLTLIDNQSSVGDRAGLKDKYGYNRLEFTRMGRSTSLLKNKVSSLQRVAYFQNEDKLIRHSWRQLDATSNTFVDKRRLLSNLEKFELYFVDSYGRKTPNWQLKPALRNPNPSQPSMELPRGIIVNFSIKQYGNIEWVFSLSEVLNHEI